MAMSRSTFLLFPLICSWAFVGHSDLLAGGGASSLPCIQKLMPCQPYLKGSSTPPASCCAPLKEIVADDAKCLCEVFNNSALMKSLNVTQESALALVKTCGAKADTSLCQKAAAPPPSNSTSANKTAAPPPKKSGASVVGGSVISVVATLISCIIVSAF